MILLDGKKSESGNHQPVSTDPSRYVGGLPPRVMSRSEGRCCSRDAERVERGAGLVDQSCVAITSQEGICGWGACMVKWTVGLRLKIRAVGRLNQDRMPRLLETDGVGSCAGGFSICVDVCIAAEGSEMLFWWVKDFSGSEDDGVGRVVMTEGFVLELGYVSVCEVDRNGFGYLQCGC